MTGRSVVERRLLLVGVGPHARRFYLPTLRRLTGEYPFRLVAAVETEAVAPHVGDVLRTCGFDAEVFAVPPFSEMMPQETAGRLDALRQRLAIDAAIISTDPLSHRSYAEWAL